MKKIDGNEIERLIEKGHVLLNENGCHVTLQAPKKWSWTAFVVLTLFLNVFGVIGYMIYFGAKKGGKISTYTLK